MNFLTPLRTQHLWRELRNPISIHRPVRRPLDVLCYFDCFPLCSDLSIALLYKWHPIVLNNLHWRHSVLQAVCWPPCGDRLDSFLSLTPTSHGDKQKANTLVGTLKIKPPRSVIYNVFVGQQQKCNNVITLCDFIKMKIRLSGKSCLFEADVGPQCV